MNLLTIARRTLALLGLSLALSAHAADASAPDTLIRQLSIETIEAVKADKAIQAGDVSKIVALVESKILPHVDFQRMTASAVGRFWRQATPEQQTRLQAEFKTLLMRTYAGALSQVKDQSIGMKPLRAQPGDPEVVVRTEIRGKGDPVQLDYRLAKMGDVWKIYDVNVLGIWLGDQYRNSFAQEIGVNGIDGLIKSLADKNAKAAGAKA
ncbi:MlaC/ttg2D family ABC transporter substrate-binding protein [Roseateles paludis]|jgi:phospholipid transport system substrate-binding protein|uniref:ABC transporter substrate-binding protein n=1 Tax=Roseateles paludis TaxID=3145238 RepID=A0ABV0G4F3_9BURK